MRRVHSHASADTVSAASVSTGCSMSAQAPPNLRPTLPVSVTVEVSSTSVTASAAPAVAVCDGR